MCNLYNLTPKDWANKWIQDAQSRVNPMAAQDVYPDQMAPIVRNAAGGGPREFVNTRWGLPSSSQALYQAAATRADKLRAKGKEVNFDELLKMEPDGGTTNVRNTSSRHWTRWLGVENRCIVPATSFAEPDPANKPESGRTPNAWFALNEDCPVFFFAGIWVSQWESVRKIKEGLITADLYGFLTTEPNGIVAPIHQKAMPVILTTDEEVETWLTAPWSEAKVLQRPLPEDRMILLPQQEPAPSAEQTGMLI